MLGTRSKLKPTWSHFWRDDLAEVLAELSETLTPHLLTFPAGPGGLGDTGMMATLPT